MVARRARSHGLVGLLLALIIAGAGCASSTSTASEPERPMACAEGPSAVPVSYDVAIGDARTTLDSSPGVALVGVIAPGTDRSAYLVRLRVETCGPSPRAQLAYAFTRMTTANDAGDLVPTLAPRAQRIEGARVVVRGEEILLGEGVWPDGERYRVSVTVR